MPKKLTIKDFRVGEMITVNERGLKVFQALKPNVKYPITFINKALIRIKDGADLHDLYIPEVNKISKPVIILLKE